MAEVLTVISSGAWILAYTTANPHEFNIPMTGISVITTESNSTSYDLKLKHVCDHKLTSGTYTLNTCPRCLGDGHYYDIKINEDGQLVTVNQIDKLLQELEKITISDRNPFHPNYGISLTSRIGQISLPNLSAIIKKDLIDAVKLLQTAQQSTEIVRSPDEVIIDVDKIVVNESGQTGLQFQVVVITAAANKMTFEGTVNI